jgi:pyrophosphate--fructose-6-phosphate 1-phosphotransferase
VCNALRLNGLVVVGGDDSNTNAAVLAEYFAENNSNIKVCGAPKTIDGDLRNEHVEISFGFDTATKVYSERVAALCADAASARKMYHICRLMGRTASHITLEVGLQVHPNLTLIGEEIRERKMGLKEVVKEMADVVAQRSLLGRNYGVFILPEGLVDFLPDISKLLGELNEIIAHNNNVPPANLTNHLSEDSRKVYTSLPVSISQQLLLDRDDHGNVAVSAIESERLLASMLDAELSRRKKLGDFDGTFKYICHFLGYEGRCSLPSIFDSTYCYTLGATAAVLIASGQTGMMSIVRNLSLPLAQWSCGGTPLTSMMNVERRHGKDKPVIKKALVELDSLPFLLLAKLRDEWKHEDRYRNPGPIQFGKEHSSQLNLTLQIMQHHVRDQQEKKQVLAEMVQAQQTAQKEQETPVSMLFNAIRSNM